MALLEVIDLVVGFRTRRSYTRAVNGVSFSVGAGETLGIVGESGSGKSVTALSLMRLLPRGGEVERGRILFEGRDLLDLSDRQMRALRGPDLAIVFQDPMSSLDPVLRIEEQVAEGIRAHERVTRRAAHRRCIDLMNMVGIPDAASALSRYPHEFSGGMRQRVSIATALALSPKLLVADEPTTALDVTIQAQVLELMSELTAESGTSLILITHDLGIVAGNADGVAVMYGGHIVEEAEASQLFASPRHPYSQGLLRALPRIGGAPNRLKPIDGRPPTRDEHVAGCPFAPRCWRELDVCTQQMPGLEPADTPSHLLACFNPSDLLGERVGRFA